MALHDAADHLCRRRIRLFSYMLLCLFSVGVQASWPPLSGTTLAYELDEEAPAAFLDRFFEAEGLPVVISPAVRSISGTLSGPRSGSPGQILSSIADSNQLVIYYDGALTYIYRANELDLRYLSLPMTQLAAFQSLLAETGLSDKWNEVRINPDIGLVMATGTPRFLDQMQQLAGTLSVRTQAPRETTFRYFPLKYAWAGDTVFTVGNRQVSVPGVAALLQELLYGPSIPAGAPSPRGTQLLRPSAQRLGGTGLASFDQRPVDAATASSYAYGAGSSAPEQRVGQPLSSYAPADPDQPRIVSDPYRNAIIVRDVPERMPVYEELISTLDIPSEVVEIEATIFDVNTGRMEELGIDWRLQNARHEFLFGPKPDLAATQAANDIDVLPQRFEGFQVGAIIGDGAQFVARISALESDDLTEVTSQPHVVTLNDVEAVIESSRTVYVPVEGAYEVDLFNVFAGTVLRVTPHIVRDGEETQIRLLVTVEDGDVEVQTVTSGDTVSTIPTVTRNAVNTQAIIVAGQSLLLGGLDRNAATRTVTKVPGLGDIPWLGRLFRNDGTSHARSERMFLISPRLVVASPTLAAAAGRPIPLPTSPTPGFSTDDKKPATPSVPVVPAPVQPTTEPSPRRAPRPSGPPNHPRVRTR